MSVLKASRLPACASWMRACSSIRDDFITMRKTTNQYFTKTEDSPKTGWGPETAPHPVFGLLLMVSRSTNTDNKNGLGCPAVPKQIQDSPDDHPQRRRPGKDSRKNGKNWHMEDEPAQNRGKRRGKDHRQSRTPKLLEIRDSFLLEQSKPRGKEKPRNDEWYECCTHAR